MLFYLELEFIKHKHSSVLFVQLESPKNSFMKNWALFMKEGFLIFYSRYCTLPAIPFFNLSEANGYRVGETLHLSRLSMNALNFVEGTIKKLTKAYPTPFISLYFCNGVGQIFQKHFLLISFLTVYQFLLSSSILQIEAFSNINLLNKQLFQLLLLLLFNSN